MTSRPLIAMVALLIGLAAPGLPPLESVAYAVPGLTNMRAAQAQTIQ